MCRSRRIQRVRRFWCVSIFDFQCRTDTVINKKEIMWEICSVSCFCFQYSALQNLLKLNVSTKFVHEKKVKVKSKNLTKNKATLPFLCYRAALSANVLLSVSCPRFTPFKVAWQRKEGKRGRGGKMNVRSSRFCELHFTLNSPFPSTFPKFHFSLKQKTTLVA